MRTTLAEGEGGVQITGIMQTGFGSACVRAERKAMSAWGPGARHRAPSGGQRSLKLWGFHHF